MHDARACSPCVRVPRRVLRCAPLLAGLAMACGGPQSKDGTADQQDDAADGGFDTGPTLSLDPLGFDLHEAGPFRVGYAQLIVDYEVLGAVRSIPVSVWYPTQATAGDPVRYIDLYVDPVALGGAPAAAPVYADGYPVLLYSHGYQGFSGTSAFLMHHVVSHGWVAVAPEHVNNTLTDHVDPLPTAHWVHRPLDLREALTAAAARAPLAGPLDLARVALSGHSFGVHTAWAAGGATYAPDGIDEACATGFSGQGCTVAEREALLSGDLNTPQASTAILLAGSINRPMFGPEGHRSMQGPVLSLSGSADPVGADEQFATTQGLDHTWVELEGGCHQTFALGTCDTLPTEDGFFIVRSWSLAWLRHHLLDDTSVPTMTLLSGEAPVADGVRVQRRAAGDP